MERTASRAWKWLAIVSFIAFQLLAHFVLRDSIGVLAVSGLTHAIANLLLLWYFARTLRSGSESLITRLARRVHGTLAPEMAVFTRRVTVAWSVFFAGQVVVSGLLLALAPLEAWSMFINLINLPLIVLMFAGEYLYRTIRYPNHPRASITRVLRAYGEVAMDSKRAKAL